MSFWRQGSRGRGSGGGLEKGNSWRREEQEEPDRESRKEKPCRFYGQTGACRFGSTCKFSHDLAPERGDKGPSTERLPRPEETREQQQAKADYNSWKRIIKRPPRPNDDWTVEQLWNGALTILNGDEREWKQMLPRDLEDEEYHGREHIRIILSMRTRPRGYDAYMRLVRPFLLVITHSAFLDCLSVDTFVGGLYNFIGGTNGTRAVPFFDNLCETLVSEHINAVVGTVPTNADTILVAASTALRELLRREYRVRFNDDLPVVVDYMEAAVQVMSGETPSPTTTVVRSHIGEIRAMVARAKGLLAQEQEHPDTLANNTTTSTYPRALVVPRDRHDNDKADITQIQIFPTREEILSNDTDFLPSTDLRQPHFLGDQAERHIDTHFRLLRHDIFGEMKDVLGGLVQAVNDNPAAPKLHTGDFRANQYHNAYISSVSFDNRRGLEMNITFTPPSAVRSKQESQRRMWWEESKRLSEGVLLSFISFQGGQVQHSFFTVTGRNTDTREDNGLTKKDYQSTITAKLASHDQVNVENAVHLSCQKIRGVLIEFPGILPATFTPILENLQDMQRHSRLPFRQWILPDKISSPHEVEQIKVPPPFYARSRGFTFSLEPILKPDTLHVRSMSVNPNSPADDPNIVAEMEARTGLDRGQCRALLAALTREFALIKGPPGTGKSHLGVQFMKVLLHCKKTVALGPVVVVCYTNHALDQFLEHLLETGVKKIIRIGGKSQSSALEAHNLRTISQTESRTRSEKYLLAKLYQALEGQTDRIKADLDRVRGVLKREKWSSLQHHLLRTWPRIHAQFPQVDEEGFQVVGRHPFDIWASSGKTSADSESTGEDTRTQQELEHIIQKAEADVHSLTLGERGELVELWTEEVYVQTLDDLFEKVSMTNAIHRQLTNIHDEVDRRVLQDADVIGITTTGLAKRISTLKRVQCKVVICEEAGEVMEPHMISALLPTIEHFIQIGDPEQLRPQINNYKLSLESREGALYQLDRSQFERLSVAQPGRPKMPIAELNVQRRMRPEISTLIRETVYPKLQDHPSTYDLGDVVGMRKNVFWLDHDHLEEGQRSEMHHKSHSNTWEVAMVHALVRHIVRQGAYSSSDIAVLTPYSGQLQALRSAMRNDFEIVLSDRDKDVLEKDGFQGDEIENQPGHRKAPLEKKQLSELLRVATVDNFQGEEAKVIIVSLVRSNMEKKVGFLRTTNRINVLLSRARNGMYLIGNTETYANIPMWQKVIGMLRASDSVGSVLKVDARSRVSGGYQTAVICARPDAIQKACTMSFHVLSLVNVSMNHASMLVKSEPAEKTAASVASR